MEQQYVTREELNGFGVRVGLLEVAHGKTETNVEHNAAAIEKLIAYTNSLLMKVMFIVCAPILVMILVQIFKK